MSTNWADFAEDDDGELDFQVELPEREETSVDSKGIKKVTFFERKEDGSIVKVTQRVKVITLKQKTPLRTFERREQWQPFGKAAKGPEEGVTYMSNEDVFMVTPAQDEAEEKNDSFQQDFLNKVGNIRVRTGGPLDGGATKGPAKASSLPSSGAYRPPRPTGAVLRGPDEQAPALRVSNISPQATKDDIYRLFQPFGRIARVYLADPPRGYAFVTYANESDGKKAKQALDKYGYDHLILKVEWAKPSTNRPQSSMRFASGYGKALPQDNEKSTK